VYIVICPKNVGQTVSLSAQTDSLRYDFRAPWRRAASLFNCPENKDSAGGVQEASDTYTTQGRCVYY
jgi:hypothetical protein